MGILVYSLLAWIQYYLTFQTGNIFLQTLSGDRLFAVVIAKTVNVKSRLGGFLPATITHL